MNELYKHKEQHKEKKKFNIRYTSAGDKRVCSFCGAEISPDSMFCEECGNPLGGITCPKCGTLSFRSFCSNCNYPLNEMAQEAVKTAKRDPRFQRAQQLASELSALEERISQLSREETEEEKSLDTSSLLSEEDRAAAANYAALFGGIADMTVPDTPATEKIVKPKERRQFSANKDLLKAAVAEYKSKAAELERQIASMLPDPGTPPEEQRNFFCARKITQIEMRSVRQEWICNYCGCHHSQPSECAEPQLGGTWTFVKVPHPVTKIVYD